jgi:hypothetical protein
MILIFALTIFAITPEQEISTKSYWIGFNDIIHNFNKAINAKPNTAALEIKQTIAKIAIAEPAKLLLPKVEIIELGSDQLTKSFFDICKIE